MRDSLFYDWLLNILPFGLCGAMKAAEDEYDLLSDSVILQMTTVFIDRAAPRSAQDC